MRDMFGTELTESQARGLLGRKGPQAGGYAAPPGTGPGGETCKSCKHLFHNRMAKTYLKCGLARGKWTGGRGSDILARAPACRLWERA